MTKMAIFSAITSLAVAGGLGAFLKADKKKKLVTTKPVLRGVINIKAPHAITEEDFNTVWHAIVLNHGMPGGPAIERLHAELLARSSGGNRKAPTILSAVIGRGSNVTLTKRRAAGLIAKPNEEILPLRDTRWVWVLTK